MAVNDEALEVAVDAFEENEQGVEVRLRIGNRADRALHYIAGVRAIDYDPGTRHLTVRLTDEGRQIVPGAVNLRPPLRYIDPGSDAELTLQLPAQITRLAPSPDGDRRKVAFETLRIADAEEVSVVIGWSDVPFYEDPRVAAEMVMPSVHWQQHRNEAVLSRRSGD